MLKLTDSQMIVLSKAAQRDDGATVVPERMSKAGAMKVGSSLIGRKLMREIRAKPGMPIWREDEDGRQFSLIITRAGRDAIGVEDDEETRTPPGANAAKSTLSQPSPLSVGTDKSQRFIRLSSNGKVAPGAEILIRLIGAPVQIRGTTYGHQLHIRKFPKGAS